MLKATATKEESTTVEDVSTRVLRSSSKLDLLEEEWYSLLERCPSHTVFSTPDWLVPMAEVYERRMRPLTIAVFQGEQLIGLAPFAVVRQKGLLKTLRFLGMGPFSYPLSDYDNIISAQGKEALVARAVMNRLRSLATEWHTMDLAEIPETSPMLSPLLQEARSLNWIVVAKPRRSSFVLPLPGHWEEFLSALSPKFRSGMERKARKLQRDLGGNFQLMQGLGKETELNDAVDLFISLHSRQWRERGLPGLFAYEGAGDFLRRASQRLARRGILQVGLLSGAEGPLSISLNYRYRGIVYVYNSGRDPSPKYSKYSLGTLLNRYLIKAAIEAGDSEFDFLRGEGNYKASYRVKPMTHYRVGIWRAKPLFLASEAWGRARDTARPLVRSGRGTLTRLKG